MIEQSTDEWSRSRTLFAAIKLGGAQHRPDNIYMLHENLPIDFSARCASAAQCTSICRSTEVAKLDVDNFLWTACQFAWKTRNGGRWSLFFPVGTTAAAFWEWRQAIMIRIIGCGPLRVSFKPGVVRIAGGWFFYYGPNYPRNVCPLKILSFYFFFKRTHFFFPSALFGIPLVAQTSLSLVWY